MRKILLVEDDPMLRELISEVLEGTISFCQVDTAVDAFEAFVLIKKLSYDLIISDYELPYVDGLTFLKALRDKNRHANIRRQIPAILLSGHQEKDLCLTQLPDIRFLAKPPQFEKMIQVIEDLLDQQVLSCHP